jgi:uncharacterized SAM-binding protein YcdF (DUF218 family)
MKRKFTKIIQLIRRIEVPKLKQFFQGFALFLSLLLGMWLVFTTITLVSASSKPVDAFFVLGGSIRREMHVASEVQQYPQVPVLISHGSPEPCIKLVFQRQAAEEQNVWLENCANSTFENFYYGIPILRRWGVHKVKLITSPTHLPRAKWMAQILLGAQGIWVEPEIVQEKGVPANKEFWQKTGADVMRSLGWAGLSQIIQPQCSKVIKLTDVNMQTWQNRPFKCERQGGLGSGGSVGE